MPHFDEKHLELLRRETPGCAVKKHFNNAGAALMPAVVVSAMQSYSEFESLHGGYEAADLKKESIEGFYHAMARLLGTQARNVAITSSATNSFARAVSALPLKPGDSILIAQEDYISNQITFLSLRDRMGVRLLRARSHPDGGVDVADMERLMDEHHPSLVSLSHIPTNTGLIQPAEEIGALCRARSIPYLLDACQSAGQLPLDINALHCDFLTGTFRKFLRGPRGAGFLFVSDRILEKPWGPLYPDMRSADWTTKDSYRFRSDARRFEDWELPYALVLGARASLEYAWGLGLENIALRNAELGRMVRKELSALGLTLLDRGDRQSSIITVKIDGWEPGDLLQTLRSKNINASIASRSSAIPDFDSKGVMWVLRISPHYYNTIEEIGTLAEALRELKKS